jgi:hypothetical protein
VLADVVHGVGGGEDLRFVDVVYAEGFEDLDLSSVAGSRESWEVREK